MPDVAAGPANPSPYQRIAKSWKVAFRSELARSSMVDLPVEREGAADTTWRSNDRDTYIAAPSRSTGRSTMELRASSDLNATFQLLAMRW